MMLKLLAQEACKRSLEIITGERRLFYSYDLKVKMLAPSSQRATTVTPDLKISKQINTQIFQNTLFLLGCSYLSFQLRVCTFPVANSS